MDGNQAFWVRVWLILVAGFVLFIWGILASNAVQMHTLVSAGYCERRDSGAWIKCDLLKDVVIK